MGQPPDDPDRRMTPGSARRSRAWRALISALAGGGITAASLGPLSAGAVATGGSGVTLGPVRTVEAPPPEPTETEPTTTSSSTQAPATPTSAPTTTATTTSPTPTAPAEAGTQVPPPPKPKVEHPAVVLQQSQQATPSKRESESPTTTATKPGETGTGATEANGANNVVAAPDVVAAQIGALAAELSGSAASTQSL